MIKKKKTGRRTVQIHINLAAGWDMSKFSFLPYPRDHQFLQPPHTELKSEWEAREAGGSEKYIFKRT